MSLRAWLVFPAILAVFLVVGCGGGGGSNAKLVPVGGTLLVDGAALDGVSVTFVPDISMKDSSGGVGTTDATGAFTVTELSQNRPGLPPGKYTLTYSRMRLPDGSAAPKPEAGKPVDPGVIQVETFPDHLTTLNPRVTANQVEIPAAGNPKLELKISKKGALR